MSERLLVTGGAGFVGSSLALRLLAEQGGAEVIAFDNLCRRGSELNLPRLAAAGARFVHGDLRCAEDLAAVGPVDWIFDCAALPSAQAGYAGAARGVIDANLLGSVCCLEYAARHGAGLVFLSTSRVYPIAALRALPLERRGERLALRAGSAGSGWSEHGIGAAFPLAGARSLYGATKLCSELLIEEYAAIHGLRTLVLRCGVIAGPWQQGRVDQGFLSLWAARHRYGGSLDYIGFGGEGLQVRDVLHVEDFCDLVLLLLRDADRHAGKIYCAGGGPELSLSLRELTALLGELCKRKLAPGARAETHPSDIPWFVTDNRELSQATGWRPRRSLQQLLEDVIRWLDSERGQLERIFAA